MSTPTPAPPDLTGPAGRQSALVGWLIGPLALLAIFGGLAIVRSRSDWIVAAVLGGALGAAVLWILVSSLSPALPDKTCPRCGSEALKRLDPGTTQGVTCGACDWSDPSVSSFYLAEEEGVPLEPIALAGRRGPARRAPRPSKRPHPPEGHAPHPLP